MVRTRSGREVGTAGNNMAKAEASSGKMPDGGATAPASGDSSLSESSKTG